LLVSRLMSLHWCYDLKQGYVRYRVPLDMAYRHTRVPTYALNVEGVDTLSVFKQLALTNICAWSGNYYAVNVMERLGLAETGAVRLGIVHCLDENDVEKVVAGLREVTMGYFLYLCKRPCNSPPIVSIQQFCWTVRGLSNVINHMVTSPNEL
jgi:hypothetical protein